MSELFSMQGRYNRARYIWMTLGISLITYAVAFMIGIMMGMMGGSESAASMIGGVVGIAANVILAFVTVKRLHDLDRPGWHFWLLLVPFYNLYLGVVLLFVGGTSGSNRFGVSPVAS